MPQFIPAPAGGGSTLDSVYSPAGSVLVAGAGTALVDGIYTIDGTYNGKNLYSLIGGSNNERIKFLPTDLTAIIVASGGSTGMNGTYYQTGDNDGKALFELDGGVGGEAISWNSTDVKWYILDSGTTYYSSTDDVDTPDLVTTWVAVSGTLPVPTVTGTYDSYWYIEDDSDQYYVAYESVDTPDLATTWELINGSAAVPTVTAYVNYPDGYILEADGAGATGWAAHSGIGHFPSAVDYYDAAEVDLTLTAADVGKIIVINYTADGANGYHTVTLPAAASGSIIGVTCKTGTGDVNIHIKPASGDEIVIMRGNTAEYIFDENLYASSFYIQIILVAVSDSKWFALSETDYGEINEYLHWQQFTTPP